MDSLRLRRHESFSLRDGWIEKYFQVLSESNTNIFVKNNGISILGIGSNMVKSLKFWLIAANIIEPTSNYKLTNFGRLLYTRDRYLESSTSLYLLHYFLCSFRNKNWVNLDNPIPTLFFNEYKCNHFTKDEFKEYAIKYFDELNLKYNIKSIDDDISVMIRMYSDDGFDINPEDNYSCPLAKLGLLKKKNRSEYVKTFNKYLWLNPLIIYFILRSNFNSDSFYIVDSLSSNDSPVSLFNIDKNTYIQILYKLQKMDYLTINSTAGLDSVYFNKTITLDEVFKYTEGDNA